MSDTTRRPPIKPISRAPKRAAASLEECRCFDEVNRRLRIGWSSPELAKFIQEENEELVHLSPGYVRKMIDDFRRSIPPAELLLTTQNTAVAANAAQKFSNGLEELEKLDELWNLQMDRIKIDVANEKKINKLFPSTGREVFYAMKIVHQTSQLKMDLGIAKRQLGEVSVSGTAAVQIGNRYDNDVGKVMADADSRRKVLGMVEALMSLGTKVSIDASEIVKGAASAYAEDDIPDGVIDIPPEPEPDLKDE